MLRKRLTWNATAAAAQVVITAAVFFFLYRFLVRSIGVDEVGLWALLLSLVSALRVSELGHLGSIVKLTAKYIALEHRQRVYHVISTAVISTAFLVGVTALTVYFLSGFLAARLPSGSDRLLPPLLVWLLLTSTGGAYQAVIEGVQRNDLKAIIQIVSTVVLFLSAIWWVPTLGSTGLVYAQCVQAALALALNILAVKTQLPELNVVPRTWLKADSRELLAYGINFQSNSVAAMLYEPVTKVLLASFGELAAVGYYEMANRMIGQLRNVITSANQILVPVFAAHADVNPDYTKEVYEKSYKLNLYISIPYYFALLAAIPFISDVWIGRVEPTFVITSILLWLGFFLNGFANPAYFAYIGQGTLRVNTLGHCLIAGLNVALGWGFGYLVGPFGVIFGWVVAWLTGSFVILYFYHRERSIPAHDAIPVGTAQLAVSSIVSSLAALGAYYIARHNLSSVWFTLFLMFLVYVGLVAVPMWRHPCGKTLRAWARS